MDLINIKWIEILIYSLKVLLKYLMLDIRKL